MIEIVTKQVKQRGYRYYMEIQLSECVPEDWTSIYNEAISQMGLHTAVDFTGCPTIETVEFVGDMVTTNDFPAMAKDGLKSFLSEFEKVMALANNICISRGVLEQQRLAADKQKEQQKREELEKINEWLNEKPKK